MESLNEDQLDGLVASFGTLFAGLVNRIADILKDETGSGKNELPPILPHQILKLRRAEWTANIRKQIPRLDQAGWTEGEIGRLETQHTALLRRYNEDEVFKAAVAVDDPTDARLDFEKAWKAVDELGGDAELLKKFCGGMAVAFPNTATMEADFSDVRWERNEYMGGLTDFSLEGCLHSKQFQDLLKLSCMN